MKILKSCIQLCLCYPSAHHLLFILIAYSIVAWIRYEQFLQVLNFDNYLEHCFDMSTYVLASFHNMPSLPRRLVTFWLPSFIYESKQSSKQTDFGSLNNAHIRSATCTEESDWCYLNSLILFHLGWRGFNHTIVSANGSMSSLFQYPNRGSRAYVAIMAVYEMTEICAEFAVNLGMVLQLNAPHRCYE